MSSGQQPEDFSSKAREILQSFVKRINDSVVNYISALAREDRCREKGYQAGIAEERTRWEAKLDKLRSTKNARLASDLCQEDAQETVGMIRSIALLSDVSDEPPKSRPLTAEKVARWPEADSGSQEYRGQK